MWFPGGQHRVSKVDTMWFLQDTTGFPHGCHVVSIWTPCVVEVTTWKPAQKTALHEANWLPCYFIFYISQVNPINYVPSRALRGNPNCKLKTHTGHREEPFLCGPA